MTRNIILSVFTCLLSIHTMVYTAAGKESPQQDWSWLNPIEKEAEDIALKFENIDGTVVRTIKEEEVLLVTKDLSREIFSKESYKGLLLNGDLITADLLSSGPRAGRWIGKAGVLGLHVKLPGAWFDLLKKRFNEQTPEQTKASHIFFRDAQDE